MSEIPKSPEELLIHNSATAILDSICKEGKTRFNFQLIGNGATFGHFCFVDIPEITQEKSESLIKKIESIINSNLSSRLKGALLNQRRHQGLDNRLIRTDFKFKNLNITFQDQPRHCLSVIFEVECEVRN